MEFTEKFLMVFIKRTKVNLEFLKTAHNDGKKVFEVTQLINSLLGLLVFPKERLDNLIDRKEPLDTYRQDGWEIPKTSLCKCKSWNNLYDYLRNMRNGISHSHIEFSSNDDKEVSSMTIWNTPLNSNIRNWEVNFTIEQLNIFTEMTTQYFLSLDSE